MRKKKSDRYIQVCNGRGAAEKRKNILLKHWSQGIVVPVSGESGITGHSRSNPDGLAGCRGGCICIMLSLLGCLLFEDTSWTSKK